MSNLQSKLSIIQSLASRCYCCFVILVLMAMVGGESMAVEPGGGEQVWRGQHHQAEQYACKLISAEQQWQEIWRKIGQDPPRAWPAGARAIAALDQRRPSGGYTLQMRGGEEQRWVVESVPPEGVASAVITRPWLIVLFAEGGVRSVACSFPE